MTMCLLTLALGFVLGWLFGAGYEVNQQNKYLEDLNQRLRELRDELAKINLNHH